MKAPRSRSHFAAWIVVVLCLGGQVHAQNLFQDGRLFVAINSQAFSVFEPDGTFANLVFVPGTQTGDVAFNYVRNLLYVTDRSGGGIYAIDATGTVVQNFAPPSAPIQLNGIEVDQLGNAYVAGADGKVHVFTSDGVFDRSIVVPNEPFILFVALSPDQTKLFVTESTFGVGVHHFDLLNSDTYLGFYGQTRVNSTLINQIAFAPDGTFYVTDDGFGNGSGTVEKYLPDGSFGGVFYTGIRAGWGLEVGPSGDILVGNTNDFSGAPKILRFDPDGTLVDQFGDPSVVGQTAGMAFYRGVLNPPTADAGPDQSIRAGDVVFLNGSGSFDDNTPTEDLAYSWTLTSRPPGSSAVLSGSDTTAASFVADVAGLYSVSLIVADSDALSSEPDFVDISSENLAPEAAAGSDEIAIVGETVTLDGSASSDPEMDPLTFQWTIISKPAGSFSTLIDAGSSSPRLTPDVEGPYVVSLTVSDLIGPGIPDEVTVTASTAEDFAESQIVTVENVVIALDASLGQVTTPGNQNAFGNFLNQAIVSIQEGNILDAIKKLDDAKLRTDGCAERGKPDGNGSERDWITECDAQATVYSALLSALSALSP